MFMVVPPKYCNTAVKCLHYCCQVICFPVSIQISITRVDVVWYFDRILEYIIVLRYNPSTNYKKCSGLKKQGSLRTPGKVHNLFHLRSCLFSGHVTYSERKKHKGTYFTYITCTVRQKELYNVISKPPRLAEK